MRDGLCKRFLQTILVSLIFPAHMSHSLFSTGTAAKVTGNTGNNMVSVKRPSRTFYQRPLPETCTAFASPKGKAFFRSAMEHGGLKSFYSLIEQHSTQTEPAYCGLSTLVIVLNALAIDPRQIWKGPWRWYEETMLNCCIDLEDVKQTGITLKQFHCLAKCQGLVSELHYVDQDVEQEQNDLIGVDRFRATVQQACVEDLDVGDCDDWPQRILVVSYSRKVLGQTGSGHFSPIAAYDEISDHMLVQDTARFKYGTHWVPLPLLYDAMKPVDPDTKRSRGYVLLGAPEADTGVSATTANKQLSQMMQPLLLHLPQKQKSARLQFKEFLNKLSSKSSTLNEPTLHDVLSFFSQNETRTGSVWNLTEVQLRPLDDTDTDGSAKCVIDLMLELLDRLLVRHIECTEDETLVQRLDECDEIKRIISGDCDSLCRPNYGRSIPITATQAMFLFYLSALPKARREEIVGVGTGAGNKAEDECLEQTAKQQLLVEADFLRMAIDVSNSDEL